MSSFYVGYLPKAPKDISRVVRRVVVVLFAIGIVISIALVGAQRRFDQSAFEFTKIRAFEGTIQVKPYPMLMVRRPGAVSPDQQFSRYLLVGVGKHGAAVSDFDGMRVELKGKLIYRAAQTMVEVMPGSVRSYGSSAPVEAAIIDGGYVRVRGEIVDSKCHTGVMNPGSGKVHRDCAVRCISGGVPPVLIDEGEPHRLLLLTNANGNRLDPGTFLDRVAEPVTVEGHLIQAGDRHELRVSRIVRAR